MIEIFGMATMILTVGSFLWMARNDYRHLDAKIDSMRELTHAIHKETQATLNGIREEMKDFHARLCVIEEKRTK